LQATPKYTLGITAEPLKFRQNLSLLYRLLFGEDKRLKRPATKSVKKEKKLYPLRIGLQKWSSLITTTCIEPKIFGRDADHTAEAEAPEQAEGDNEGIFL